MRKVLFLTWDADTSNYLESLFFPIFEGIQEKSDFQIHVIQFSWASESEVQRLMKLAASKSIGYAHQKIHKGKFQKLTVLYAVYKGLFAIKNYIQKHKIEILMPRSTMPAMMTNRLSGWLKNQKVKMIFDADGLPLEERIDFAGLQASDLQYKFLKNEETKLLRNADHIIVRTDAATNIHLHTIGKDHKSKFTKVTNGRNPHFFHFSTENRRQTRIKLGLKDDTTVFVYSGSIGPQYALGKMISIFESFFNTNVNSIFILLTRSPELVEMQIPEKLKGVIKPLAIEFDQVPNFLAAADIAFSLRLPAPSLAGIAPIKLGEYLLMGIPTIASAAIGDTEDLFKANGFCHVYDHSDPQRLFKVLEWINQPKSPRKEIIDFGQEHYSLDLTINQYLSALNKQF